MTDQAINTTEDRTIPAVVYALYILGPTHGGLTTIIGLIMAYVKRDGASAFARSHYDFLIRTFWLSIGVFLCALIVGGTLIGLGALLTFVLVGWPIMWTGGGLIGLACLYFWIRCAAGAIHLARGEAYPRPNALLI